MVHGTGKDKILVRPCETYKVIAVLDHWGIILVNRLFYSISIYKYVKNFYCNYQAVASKSNFTLIEKCVCRKTRIFAGHQDGTTSWSQCLTPISSGSGKTF